MQHATHGNGNGLNDLYILPDDATETARIVEYLKTIDQRFSWSYSDTEGQSWHGKQFIEIPFGEGLLGVIQQAAAKPLWRAAFGGRKAGAIGDLYRIATTVYGDNEEEARIKLYDRFEHISGLQLTLSE